MRWFRFYDDALNDPKVQQLPPALFKSWINLLCIASKSDGRLPEITSLAFSLRMGLPAARAVIAKLRAAGLIDEDENGLFPHNWNGRQYASDSSTERVRRHREKRGNGSGNGSTERFGNVSVTPPDTDTETEKKKGERALARARPPKFEMKEDWEPDAEQRALARKHGFSEEEVEAIALAHRAYWLGLDAVPRTAEQWQSLWRNQILREAKRKGGKRAPEPTGPARRRPDETPLDRAQRLAREENLAVERAADNMTEPNHVGYLTLLAPPGRA